MGAAARLSESGLPATLPATSNAAAAGHRVSEDAGNHSGKAVREERPARAGACGPVGAGGGHGPDAPADVGQRAAVRRAHRPRQPLKIASNLSPATS